MHQPDIHYAGELTAPFIQELLNNVENAFIEIKSINIYQDPFWLNCKQNWLNALQYAGLRIAAILTKIETDCIEHRTDDDHKCVDITLCVLRDYDYAKSQNFLEKEDDLQF